MQLERPQLAGALPHLCPLSCWQYDSALYFHNTEAGEALKQLVVLKLPASDQRPGGLGKALFAQLSALSVLSVLSALCSNASRRHFS